MSALRSLVPPPLFILLVALLLGWMYLIPSDQFPAPAGVPRAVSLPSQSPANNATSIVPAEGGGGTSPERLSHFLLRPLFSEDRRIPQPPAPTPAPAPQAEELVARRPEPVAAPAPVTAPPELPEFPAIRYLGFTKTGAISRALVRQEDSEEENWLVEGDIFAGWEVIEIGKTGLSFRRAGQVKVVQFER